MGFKVSIGILYDGFDAVYMWVFVNIICYIGVGNDIVFNICKVSLSSSLIVPS